MKFFAALGDLDGLRAALDQNANDLAIINEAFMCACRSKQEAGASLLLERSIVLDPDLGKQIDGSVGRRAFITHFVGRGRSDVKRAGLWVAFVMDQISRAAHDGDVTAFVSGLQREPRLLGDDWVDFQDGLIGAATLNDRGGIIAALLDLEPALLRRQPPPPSQAIEFAFTYAKTHLIPSLTRIWPVPDDLPHAAGMGDLAGVKRWFDAKGNPALGDVADHAPATSVHPRRTSMGRGRRAAGAGRRARMGRHQSPLRRGTSCSSTAQTSTPTGTLMSRRASCTIWSSCRTRTSRCGSSSTAASI